ncbi:MAG: multicopper oxidase domain-containing protein [Acidimicrobiales bacterium]
MIPADARLPELDRRVLGLSDLRATDAVALPAGEPDRIHSVALDGGDEGYRWTINGKVGGHDGKDGAPLKVRQGRRCGWHSRTAPTMFHPMHLHGHTFRWCRPRRAAHAETA